MYLIRQNCTDHNPNSIISNTNPHKDTLEREREPVSNSRNLIIQSHTQLVVIEKINKAQALLFGKKRTSFWECDTAKPFGCAREIFHYIAYSILCSAVLADVGCTQGQKRLLNFMIRENLVCRYTWSHFFGCQSPDSDLGPIKRIWGNKNIFS